MPTTRSKTTRRRTTKRATTKRPSTKRKASRPTMTRKKATRRKGTRKGMKKSSPSMKARKSTSRRVKKSTRKTTRKVARTSMRRTTSKKTACITGTFDGEIMTSGHVHIAPGANCKANLKAGSVQMDGSVNGNVMANHVVALGNRCKFKGTLVAPKLVAADGAAFEGFCKLGRRKAA